MDALLAVRQTFASIGEVLSWGGTFAAVFAGLAVIIGRGGELVLLGGLLVLLGPVAAHVCGRPLISLADADQRLGVLRRERVRG